MDTLDIRIIKREEEYKKNIIEGMKRIYPDCEHLQDDEILNMNPLTDNDYLFIRLQELDFIKTTIKSCEDEIKVCLEDIECSERTMVDSKISYNDVTELRRDIIYDRTKISEDQALISSLQSDYEVLAPIVDEMKGNVHVEL